MLCACNFMFGIRLYFSPHLKVPTQLLGVQPDNAIKRLLHTTTGQKSISSSLALLLLQDRRKVLKFVVL